MTKKYGTELRRAVFCVLRSAYQLEAVGAVLLAPERQRRCYFMLVSFVDAMDENAPNKETCRVLVIGAHRARLDKVFTLLVTSDVGRPLDKSSQQVRVEYLPCVAKFGFYEDEVEKRIRYLVSVDHYPVFPDGTLSSSPACLLPFFDGEVEPVDSENGPRFRGIAGAAIGSGIEGDEDTARIDAFLKTMVSGFKNKETCTPKLKTIEPNPGYESMQDELNAYKALTADEKDEVSRLQTMGPSKMAKFVVDFAAELLREALEVKRPVDESPNMEAVSKAEVDAEAVRKGDTDAAHAIMTDKNRFSCRKCRTILFGEADLQDPPHEPSQHRFSYRKQHHGACSPSDHCQSYFLQEGMDWMGDDIRKGYPEGKFGCPVCESKLGNWTWSGAQCSCGTWVVPAIQVPKSKVDLMAPQQSAVPLRACIQEKLVETDQHNRQAQQQTQLPMAMLR